MSTIVDNLKSSAETIDAKHKIVVLIPCFNEELTVGKTVAAFREALPFATIYVYDNNSTDRTIDVANQPAGAVDPQRDASGKGECRPSHVRRH